MSNSSIIDIGRRLPYLEDIAVGQQLRCTDRKRNHQPDVMSCDEIRQSIHLLRIQRTKDNVALCSCLISQDG